MELTKAEEQILHYLWKLEEATVQDILSCMDDAGKPSRTTVSTIIRILENKGAVSHKPGTGRGYIYYPLVKKEEYSRKQLFGFISRYFDNSFSSLASFFAKERPSGRVVFIFQFPATIFFLMTSLIKYVIQIVISFLSVCV